MNLRCMHSIQQLSSMLEDKSSIEDSSKFGDDVALWPTFVLESTPNCFSIPCVEA